MNTQTHSVDTNDPLFRLLLKNLEHDMVHAGFCLEAATLHSTPYEQISDALDTIKRKFRNEASKLFKDNGVDEPCDRESILRTFVWRIEVVETLQGKDLAEYVIAEKDIRAGVLSEKPDVPCGTRGRVTGIDADALPPMVSVNFGDPWGEVLCDFDEVARVTGV